MEVGGILWQHLMGGVISKEAAMKIGMGIATKVVGRATEACRAGAKVVDVAKINPMTGEVIKHQHGSLLRTAGMIEEILLLGAGEEGIGSMGDEVSAIHPKLLHKHLLGM
jgi:hypothetical protein